MRESRIAPLANHPRFMFIRSTSGKGKLTGGSMNLRMLLLTTALVVPTAAAAAPSDVNAHSFYSDAVALQKKGMTALFDKRTRPMVAQMKDAGVRVGAANKAAIAAGTPPLYCMSASAKKGMGPKDVITMLGRVPDDERRTSTLFEAWRKAMRREFPCN